MSFRGASVWRMREDLRRGIAYIAGRIVSGQQASAVYDYTASGYFQLSGDVSSSRVNVYDYGRGCHLSGTPPSLYDYGTASYFDLKVEGPKVKGYDYASRTYYEATVDGRAISVYDFGEGSFFNYSV